MKRSSLVNSKTFQARKQVLVSPILFCLLASVAAFSPAAIAAENILAPGDSNSRVTVENATVRGNETTVFFLTSPDRGDPNMGEPCALNYYSATLKPGLPSARIEKVATGVCGGLFQKSRLLENGDALIIVRDRLERWRDGEQLSSEKFSSIDAVSKLGVSTDMAGGQQYDIASNGNVVLAIQSGDHSQDASEYGGVPLVVAGLKPDGKLRWEARFSQQGAASTLERVRAGLDGSALLYISHLASGLSPSAEAQLHFIRADGSKKLLTLNEAGEAMDLESMSNMSQQDLQKMLQSQGQSDPESIKKLGVRARERGGFDVLFQRKGGGEGREGFFLYRLGSNGDMESEFALGNQIKLNGLERWFDFQVEGDQLILLSKAPVTQKVVRNVKRKWGQIIVSWIDLGTGIPTARLVPLDERYLEAAMSAGDEGQQYLDGQPGSEPALLTTLGARPLSVSVGWVSRRQVVRLHEADEQLPVFTEIADEKQAKLAKEVSRQQRKADRAAQSQRMLEAQAAAAGMSVEDFNALGNREKKEALIRSGNSDQLMQSMMNEAQAWQGASAASMPQQQAGIPQDMNTQIAAAMAQAQEQMANDPNMTPEMRAQMAAIMAQMGGGAGGQPGAMPGMPAQAASPPAADKPATMPDNALKVDSGKRGFIEFENADGRLMTLLIFNRQSGEELMKKDYADGVIYEYVDFSQFRLPLDQIGVIYRDISGMILKDLTPVVSQ